MRRLIVGLFGLLGVSVFASERPNFVFILVDDLGYKDLSCYGSEFYETPNLDRFAESGVQFMDGYAAHPVCSPTRASLMTGQNPARIGITDWIRGSSKTGPGIPKVRDLHHLPLEHVTIAEAMKEAGYRTFFAGKWHLNDAGEDGFYPEDQGFDQNIGGHHKGSPPGGYYSPYKNPKLDELKLSGNTVVIFTSDNGGLTTLGRNKSGGPTSVRPLRAGKGWCCEGGIRVPWIIRAPGVGKAGTKSEVPIYSADAYPTILELAGLPPKPEQHRDGLSLVPLLRDGKAPEREFIVWFYPHYHGSNWRPGAAIRAGKWKLVEHYAWQKVELFDLENDLGEKKDLSKEQPSPPPRRTSVRRRANLAPFGTWTLGLNGLEDRTS